MGLTDGWNCFFRLILRKTELVDYYKLGATTAAVLILEPSRMNGKTQATRIHKGLWLYKQPGSRCWYARVTFGGVTKAKSTGTTDMQLATERAEVFFIERLALCARGDESLSSASEEQPSLRQGRGRLPRPKAGGPLQAGGAEPPQPRDLTHRPRHLLPWQGRRRHHHRGYRRIPAPR